MFSLARLMTIIVGVRFFLLFSQIRRTYIVSGGEFG